MDIIAHKEQNIQSLVLQGTLTTSTVKQLVYHALILILLNIPLQQPALNIVKTAFTVYLGLLLVDLMMVYWEKYAESVTIVWVEQ